MDEHYSYTDSDMMFHYTLSERPTGFSMHTHEFFELYYFIRGNCAFRVEGTRYPLHPGDILILNRTESHVLEYDENVPYERLAFHFDPSIIKKIDPQGNLLYAFTDRKLGKGNLFSPSDFKSPLCHTLIEELRKKPEQPRLKLISLLIPILNELRIAFDTRGVSEVEESDALDKRIINYINRHLSEELSLDLICAKFYISKSQLCRVFKASTGSTVWKYVTIKRLMAAQQLIHDGTPPTRAAILCGFNDYSVFYRAYSRQFGTSPKSV